jgi:hypothetical protein
MLGGHWPPREVTDAELAGLLEDGRRLAELHRELLPLDEVDFGAEGFGARIEPYRATVAVGEEVELVVHARNPFADEDIARVKLVVPDGWTVAPERHEVSVPGRGEAGLTFRVRPAGAAARRARVAADLTVGETAFGEQAEALVDVA